MHTKKGREIFNAIKDDFSYVEIAPEAAVAGAKEMKESVAPNEKRESFLFTGLFFESIIGGILYLAITIILAKCLMPSAFNRIWAMRKMVVGRTHKLKKGE